MSLPPTPRSPQAIAPTEPTRAKALSPSTGTSPSTVFATPPPPLNDPLLKSYGNYPRKSPP
jgi:hypothetical protein